jgi:hypothetical protein
VTAQRRAAKRDWAAGLVSPRVPVFLPTDLAKDWIAVSKKLEYLSHEIVFGLQPPSAILFADDGRVGRTDLPCR